MAHLCTENGNFMVYHMPMASARSEASLMAIAQQLVQQQQQKQFQQQIQHNQPHNGSTPGFSSRDLGTGAMNAWGVQPSSTWCNKAEDPAMLPTGIYNDVLDEFCCSSESYFSEPTSVLDLSSPTLFPSAETSVPDSDYIFRDRCAAKPQLGFHAGIEISGMEMNDCGPSEKRFPGSSMKQRCFRGSIAHHGCRSNNCNLDVLNEVVTRVEENGELVGFPPSTAGFRPLNLNSTGGGCSESNGRAEFCVADATSEWMDCLMSDLQGDEAGDAVVSCFDSNPCESTESSDLPVAAVTGTCYPCTPEDAWPDSFAAFEEALCVPTSPPNVSPTSWTRDATNNEVPSSSPSCDLLSASSPDLISTRTLRRKVEEPHFLDKRAQSLHGAQSLQKLCPVQGHVGGQGRIATEFPPMQHGRDESGGKDLGDEDAATRVEIGTEMERVGYQVSAHGMQLMHLLLGSAKTVDTEYEMTEKFLSQLRCLLSKDGDAIQRLAAYFTEALSLRLASGQGASRCPVTCLQDECSTEELTLAYKTLNDACPYFKFAQLTANQAILDAMKDADKVHIIDFGISQGVQWAALLQAFASRTEGKPSRIRISGVGSPSLGENPQDSLLATGKRLKEFAKLLNLEFEFHPIVAKMDEVIPSMLKIEEGESVAVNFMLQLCHLLGDSPLPLKRTLNVAHSLSPRVVTVAEYDTNLNMGPFQKRFVNALQFFSTFFDSLEATMSREDRAKTEKFLFAEKIQNVVCCEGQERQVRWEGREQWRVIMEAAGFHASPLSHFAISQARLLLWLYCESFTLTEGQSCLSLGWQQRPLLTVSAWSSY